MLKTTTHFERIPLQKVLQIVQEQLGPQAILEELRVAHTGDLKEDHRAIDSCGKLAGRS